MEYFLIPDDAVDRRKLGFQFLVFKQQCKASIEQFLYIFNHAAEGQHEQIILTIAFTPAAKFYVTRPWRRSSMGSNRLNGLALAHVHSEIPVDPLEVLQRWDASGHRRITLAFNS